MSLSGDARPGDVVARGSACPLWPTLDHQDPVPWALRQRDGTSSSPASRGRRPVGGDGGLGGLSGRAEPHDEQKLTPPGCDATIVQNTSSTVAAPCNGFLGDVPGSTPPAGRSSSVRARRRPGRAACRLCPDRPLRSRRSTVTVGIGVELLRAPRAQVDSDDHASDGCVDLRDRLGGLDLAEDPRPTPRRRRPAGRQRRHHRGVLGIVGDPTRTLVPSSRTHSCRSSSAGPRDVIGEHVTDRPPRSTAPVDPPSPGAVPQRSSWRSRTAYCCAWCGPSVARPPPDMVTGSSGSGGPAPPSSRDFTPSTSRGRDRTAARPASA